MAIQFNNLKINNQILNFATDEKNLLLITYNHRRSFRKFLRILRNRDNFNNGIVVVNEQITTGLLKVSPSKRPRLIRYHWWMFRTFFKKWVIFLELGIDPQYLRTSVGLYYTASYHGVVAKYVAQEPQMRLIFEKLEQSTERFVANFSDLKAQWVNEFLTKVRTIYENELRTLIPDDLTYNLVLEYLIQQTNLRILAGRVTFLQALWDKIYSLQDLKYYCVCERQAKRQKLNRQLFQYREIKIVTDRYSKILSWDILKTKTLWYQTRKLLKKYQHYFRLHPNKIHIDKRTLQQLLFQHHKKQVRPEILKMWHEIEGLTSRYVARNERLITSLLVDETLSLQTRLGQLIHGLHKELLIQKRPVRKTRNLGIKIFDFFRFVNLVVRDFTKFYNDNGVRINKFTKSRFYDNLKIKLLIACLLKKEFVVLPNVIQHLSVEELKKLNQVINKVQILCPDMNIIFISKEKYQAKNKLLWMRNTKIDE